MQLTIAVPTFNRCEYLRRALTSIVRDLPAVAPGIVVALKIYDNASTDDTPAVCAQFAAREPRLTVLRRPANIGADANILQAVADAAGDYVWIFGDDDYLLPGVLPQLCAILEAGTLAVLKLAATEERSLDGICRGIQAVPASKPSSDLTVQALPSADAILATFGMGLGNFSSMIFAVPFIQSRVDAEDPDLFRSGYSQLYWIYRGLWGRAGSFGHVATPTLVIRIEMIPRDAFADRVAVGLERLRVLLTGIGYSPQVLERLCRQQQDANLVWQVKARKIKAYPLRKDIGAFLMAASGLRVRLKILVIASLPGVLFKRLWVRL